MGVRRKRRAAVNGFLNVLKPAGVTSHHCVAVVRKIFNTTEVGHAGTLDPMATGVLVMALGRATKFLQHLTSDKEYRGVIRFGVTTDTDDITGTTLTERPAPWVTEQLARQHLQSFVGTINQTPPKISALKIDGKRLYELARSNAEFNVKSRQVVIHRIDMLDFIGGKYPEANIHVECGAGTYIRSIARECGEAIEIPSCEPVEDDTLKNRHGQPCVGGTLVSLERTRSGSFTIDQSHGFDEIRTFLEAGEAPIQSIDAAIPHVPLVRLPAGKINHWIANGQVQVYPHDIRRALDSDDLVPLVHEMFVRVYDPSGAFLGVSIVDETTAQSGRFILRRRTFASYDYEIQRTPYNTDTSTLVCEQ